MSSDQAIKQVLRFMYKQVPFKRQLFTAMRSIYAPPQSVHQHFYFDGRFDTKIENIVFTMNNHNSKLETSVFWSGVLGGYEKSSLRLWVHLCKNAKTILDIGANTGIYSLIAKALNPQAFVYSFEPILRIYNMMIQNCLDNNFHINSFNYALSNYNGQGLIYDLKYDHHYHASLSREDITYSEDQITRRKIPIKRIDTFVEEHSIERIDLMKIDVEGHEGEVIEGMGKYLALMKPTIILEIKSEEKARKIERLISDANYMYFDIEEDLGPRKTPSLSKSSSWNYLICTKDIAENLGLVGRVGNIRDEQHYGDITANRSS